MDFRIKSTAETRAVVPGVFAKIERERDAEQKRAQWLQLKRGKFGASSAWKFWTTKLSVADNDTVRNYLKLKAAECDGLIPPELHGAPLRHGNDEELPGALDFIEKTGIQLTAYGDDQEWIPWSRSDQVGCTPDGLIRGTLTHPDTAQIIENATAIFEQKNHQTIEAFEKFASMKSGTELLDAEYKYWVQMQHQMMTTEAIFGVFQSRYTRHATGETQVAWFVVPRNESFIAQHAARMLKAVQERDEYRAKRSGRTYENLSLYISQ